MQLLTAPIKDVVPFRLRHKANRTRLAARQPTSALRLLPDFLVIGAMRGGTSSLFKYLSYHPNIAPSLRKEIEFFTREYHRGEQWYRAHFPLRSRRELSERVRRRPFLTFEATPYYLFHPLAPERAAHVVPDAKLIVMLRDPVERAYSHYQHARRLGIEPLAFEDAIEQEEMRLAGERERIEEDLDYYSRVHHRYSYIARGRYFEQMQRWLSRYDRGQVLVLQSECFYRDPAAVYRRVLEFLNLPLWEPTEWRNHSYSRDDEPRHASIDLHLRKSLQRRFSDHNANLYKLIGEDYGW